MVGRIFMPRCRRAANLNDRLTSRKARLLRAKLHEQTGRLRAAAEIYRGLARDGAVEEIAGKSRQLAPWRGPRRDSHGSRRYTDESSARSIHARHRCPRGDA